MFTIHPYNFPSFTNALNSLSTVTGHTLRFATNSGMLSVHPAFRRKGLGSRLQCEAEHWAKHSGRKARMVCFVINVNTDLIARYRGQGFRPTGHSKKWDPSFVKNLLPEYRASYFVEYGKAL